MHKQPLLQEFSWLTKVPFATANEALKALVRRKMITPKGDGSFFTIPDPDLLSIFADYLKAQDTDVPWHPFKLTLQQKRQLVWLSTLPPDTTKDGSAWINLFNEHHLDINVADWLQMQQFEWFIEKENHLFSLGTDKINYYLTALRYEQNIKGTV